jgi:non-ribosomal peptide synthetase component F
MWTKLFYFQIYIKGPSLAIGYLNRPELNAERFVTYQEHGRLYRTGDWGYMLSDGSLEICGRCDSMVKIRGYSIETQVCLFNDDIVPGWRYLLGITDSAT